jgi:hypothetical protein
VTCDAPGNQAPQVPGQSIPEGLEEIVPVPAPFSKTWRNSPGTTLTIVVPLADVQVALEAVTKYVPAIACVAYGIVGFCSVEAKPLGPFQE